MGKEKGAYVSKRRNLQPVRTLQIPCQLLRENSFRRGLSFSPQTRKAVSLTGPLCCVLSIDSPHTHTHTHFLSTISLARQREDTYLYLLNKKNYLLSGAVISSCACVDKAAVEATGNKIRSEVAHEYLKWITKQHEERKGGVQWMVGGLENMSGPRYDF